RPDGTIVQQEQDVLRQIGAWLHVNGAAIYGSRPWRVFGEGPTTQAAGACQEKQAKPYTWRDFRCTRNHGPVYAIELGWPNGGTVTIGAITPADGVRNVRLLGSREPVNWQSSPKGLVIHPGKRPSGPATYVYEIDLASAGTNH
ncbi:hypothetical protein KMY60_27790, partial [Klebsiella pneumoniae]|uniref:alpha-L-fucosidase C-terminal domain-containing protein n=1 Tax=Klebsiella pneumoniae TaxID=573 RepID=UPI0020032B99